MTKISIHVRQCTIFAILFSIRDSEFSSENDIIKNVSKKTSYQPKAGYIWSELMDIENSSVTLVDVWYIRPEKHTGVTHIGLTRFN